MPNYTAQYNGRTVTLTGDTPPSEQDFDAAFAQIDNQQPIQAGVEINKVVDSAKGLWSGLNDAPRAINKVLSNVSNPVINAVTYPVAQLKHEIQGTNTEPYSSFAQRHNNIRARQLDENSGLYHPQTGWGKTFNAIGSFLPTLALPEVNAFKGTKLLSKIGNMGLTGAYQGGLIGGVNAINNNQNIGQGIGRGATVGGIVGGGLPIAGAAFEKVQPNIAQAMSGIPKESYQRALNGLKSGQDFFAGKFDKVKSFYPVTQKINNAIENNFKPQEYFTNKYKELGQNAENFANRYFTPDNVTNENYRKIAEKVKGGTEFLNTLLGGMVGNQTKSLANDAPVPVMDIFNIIGSSIKTAGRGSVHNPSGLAAEPIAEAMQRRILNTSLKPYNMTADDVFNTMEETGLTFRTVLESQGINPDDLVIDRIGLHNEKEYWQHQINHNADWKPHKGIVDRWQGGFNNILRENTDYAKANDEYANLKNLLNEHSWLENPDSIASKISSLDGKSGILFDTKGKLQQLDDLLPNLYKFKNELENITNKQQAQQALKSNLSPSIYNNMGNYNKAPLDVQYAFEQLNNKSPNKFLDEARALSEQQTNEQAQKQLLQKGLINNPKNILDNKSEDAYNAFQQLNESASPENKFMNQLEDLKARGDFETFRPHHNDSKIPALGHGALGLYSIESMLHGNFAPLGIQALLGSQSSPAMQKSILRLYNQSTKIAPYLPRTVATATKKRKNK